MPRNCATLEGLDLESPSSGFSGDFKIRVTSPAAAMTSTPSGYCYPVQHDQFFNVQILQSPANAATDGIRLHYQGPRELKDLSGAVLIFHTAVAPVPGSEAISAVTMVRNESGQLLFAGGSISFEETLSADLPELSWSAVDLGCPFVPSQTGTTSNQSKTVAVAIQTSSGANFTLSAHQSAQASVSCAVSIVELGGAVINQGSLANHARPSEISFLVWRTALFK
jgi:hypothetical protein